MPGSSPMRTALRAWLAARFTPDTAAAVAPPVTDASFEAHRRWNAELYDAGWAAVAWPAEYGGRDADLGGQLAVAEELAATGAPGPVNAIGVANIAPAIMAVGTPEQRERFLRPMLRGDEIWCQGMSEPDAGSDLAALRCRAELHGDHFVVNGQKTWNSNGDRAHWCQLYVRTDANTSRHRGISCLLVDMGSPGIEVRPIRTMAGDAGFADVFFHDVRVPADALLGALHEGWAVATRTLSNERAGVAMLALQRRRKLDRLIEQATSVRHDGRRPADDARIRAAIAECYVDARILEFLAHRTLGAARAGRQPGAEGSVIKLAWSLGDQRLADVAVDVAGIETVAAKAPAVAARELLASRSLTIAGGTTEVNRTIIGERVLGLPKEPSISQGDRT